MKYNPALGTEAGKERPLLLRRRQGVHETPWGGGADAAIAGGDARMLLDFPVFVPEAWLQRCALGSVSRAGRVTGLTQRLRARSTLTPCFSAIAYQRKDSA